MKFYNLRDAFYQAKSERYRMFLYAIVWGPIYLQQISLGFNEIAPLMNVVHALFSSSTYTFISLNYKILIKTTFHFFEELSFGTSRISVLQQKRHSAEHCVPPSFTFQCAAFLKPLH